MFFEAFLSIGNIRIKQIEGMKNSSSKRVLKLLKEPYKLLLTILIGNTLVNIAASSVLTDFFYSIFGERGLGISILFMTMILLIFVILMMH